MPKEVAMTISEIDKDGKEHLIAEYDEEQALDCLAHVDAQYEAHRRAHPEENLKPLPPGEWEKYLDWATDLQRKEEHD